MTVHCKPLNHLHVTVGKAAPSPAPTITYEAAMPCLHGSEPGIVLSHSSGRPEDGLHLTEDAILGLPGILRVHAADALAVGAGETVSLAHPVKQVYRVWDSWSAHDADAIADGIDAVWAARP